MKKTLSVIIIVLIIILFGLWWQSSTSKPNTVTNFEECVLAGNPILESYPRKCINKGQMFTEIIDPIKGNTPTSADNAPEGSLHNLPVPKAVSAVRTLVASELGISEGLVIVMTAFQRNWPNSCLGLNREDELCTQVITPGYEVTVQAEGKEFKYRTNQEGTVSREEK